MGHGIAPAQRLPIEVREVSKGARRKERMTNILDGAFDASFLIATRHLARLRREMIVTAKFEQAGMKTNGLATTFQDHGFKVVVEYGSGTTAPVVKSMHMAQQKVLQ